MPISADWSPAGIMVTTSHTRRYGSDDPLYAPADEPVKGGKAAGCYSLPLNPTDTARLHGWWDNPAAANGLIAPILPSAVLLG